MTPAVTQVSCPNCRQPIQATVEQVIDVSQDPQAKARLLSGELNRVHCPYCGYQGQLSTPLVYHDPAKELLLTFVPPEVGLNKDDQERVLGQLINQIMQRLPPENRKAYLLQPQPVLTLQGLVERVLEADGVTKEQLEAQREKVRLFETMLRTPEEDLEAFVREHDEALDAAFFQLATLALQATPDARAREAASRRLEQVLALSSYGKTLIQQEEELRAAAESLQALGEGLTREKLLDLFVQAPNEARVSALVSLTRPALDYAFFALLAERIDQAEGEEKARLESLRNQILELTEQVDRLQQARAAQAAERLRALLEAPDLDRAVEEALPYVDELFLATLDANLQVARDQGNLEAAARLSEVRDKILQKLEAALPPGIRLAQQVVQAESDEQAQQLLEANQEAIDEEFLNAMLGTAQQLENAGDTEQAERLRRLHRAALRLKMRREMQRGEPPPAAKA